MYYSYKTLPELQQYDPKDRARIHRQVANPLGFRLVFGLALGAGIGLLTQILSLCLHGAAPPRQILLVVLMAISIGAASGLVALLKLNGMDRNLLRDYNASRGVPDR